MSGASLKYEVAGFAIGELGINQMHEAANGVVLDGSNVDYMTARDATANERFDAAIGGGLGTLSTAFMVKAPFTASLRGGAGVPIGHTMATASRAMLLVTNEAIVASVKLVARGSAKASRLCGCAYMRYSVRFWSIRSTMTYPAAFRGRGIMRVFHGGKLDQVRDSLWVTTSEKYVRLYAKEAEGVVNSFDVTSSTMRNWLDKGLIEPKLGKHVKYPLAPDGSEFKLVGEASVDIFEHATK